MDADLQKLIASAREQASAIEAREAEADRQREAGDLPPMTQAVRAKQLMDLEAARQRRDWADFAERTQ